MSLRALIDKAIETAGSQAKLAELMNVKQQHISAWKTGVRNCTTATRIELCKIANYDLPTALLEQVVESLDESNSTQAEAAKTLSALLKAFPKNGERMSSQVSRLIIKILTKYRHLFLVGLSRDQPPSSGGMNTEKLSKRGVGMVPCSV